MNRQSAGVPAAYGRSCEECVRMKCKCIVRLDGRCDRCHRLDRECRPSTSRRSRSSKRTQPRQSLRNDRAEDRTARLEARVEQLVASIQAITTSNLSATGIVDHPSSTSESSLPTHGGPSTAASNAASSTALTPESRSGTSATWNLWYEADLTELEAEQRLATFVRHHLHWFPCVYIPPGTTAKQLYLDKPSLWLSVMAVASRSKDEGNRLSKIMRQHLAENIVIKSEKSLDILNGLLVFIAWYHLFAQRPDGSLVTSLSALTQLAVSLVFDLRLNKRVLNHFWNCVNAAQFAWMEQPHTLTRDEIRAALACFLLTSILSSCIQKMDSLRWTPSMESSLRELELNNEWEGDGVLASMVKIQLVAEKAALSEWYDATLTPREELRVPTALLMQKAVEELEQLKASIPADMLNDKAVSMMYLNTQAVMVEPALCQLATNKETAPFRRLKYLQACRVAVAQWCKGYFSVPLEEWHGTAFPNAFAIARNVMLLLYLSTCDEPGWDKQEVRAEMDVLAMLDRHCADLANLGSQLGFPDGADNIFSMHSRQLAALRPLVVARLAGTTDHDPMALGPDGGGGTGDFTWDALFDLDLFNSQWLAPMS